MNLAQLSLISIVRIYRWTIAPAQSFLFGPLGHCRYSPTCSQYAIDAIRSHGALAGSWLAIQRICRCHPWGDCGLDPVPPSHLPPAPSISSSSASSFSSSPPS